MQTEGSSLAKHENMLDYVDFLHCAQIWSVFDFLKSTNLHRHSIRFSAGQRDVKFWFVVRLNYPDFG